ncbi:MAG: flagellar assembly protein FliW [Treponemataceae bacterium]|nr:flagellar assembly protein FliW [Treponemataceae bacterium]
MKQNIKMPDGLLGFEEYKEFDLFESEYKPFMVLQSVQDANLSFFLIDPFLFRPDYEMDIDDEILSKIGIENPGDVIVLAIVTIPSDGSSVTANLQGPVIINRQNGCAMQVALGDSRWSTKHDILSELKKNNPEGIC